MRAPFSPVSSGQALQFSATEHNAFIRAALRKENGNIRFPNPPNFGPHIGATVIVYNASNPAVDFEKGDVVKIVDEYRDPNIDAPINNGKRLAERVFTADVPESTDPLNTVYAIVLELIEGEYTRTVISPDDTTVPAKSGHAIVDEVAIATVDVKDANHRYARPNGKTLDSTSDPMAPYIILGTPPSAAVLDMHVWQKGISTVIRTGIAVDNIPPNDVGTVRLLYNGSNEQWDGSNHTVEAYQDIPGDQITAGLVVYVAYFPEDDKWRVIAAECEPQAAPPSPGHGDDVAAAGTTQGTATQLDFPVNRVTSSTPASAEGVKLPDTFGQGDECVVRNVSGNTINVYPPTAYYINEEAQNASVTLADDVTGRFHLVQPDMWVY